jgi:hypothetical protein
MRSETAPDEELSLEMTPGTPVPGRNPVTVLIFLLILLLLSIGGRAATAGDPASPAVAQVGNRQVRVDEVTRLAGDLAKKGQSPDSAKATALEALIRRNLMVLEAEARGMEQDERRQRMWKKMDGDLLRGALEKELTKDVVVTDEELADLIERGSRQVVTREIAFEDSATAAQVTAQIKAGKLDFAEAAKQYSIDPAAKTTAGLAPPMSELGLALGPLKPLLDGQPGTTYGPFRFRQLWYLTRIESRERASVEIWDPDLLRPRVLDVRRQEALATFLEQMKQKYHYRFNAAASHQVADRVRLVVAAQDARSVKIAAAGGVAPDGASLITFEPPKPGFDQWGLSDSLRAQDLYAHDQGGRTVGVYVDRMAKLPIDFVAPSSNPSKVELYCEDFFKDDVYPIEAKARGLAEKIHYEQSRKNRYEQFLVDQLYEQEIYDKIKPDLNTLEAYWRAHPEMFPPRPVIVATSICYPTDAEANQAKLRMDQGLGFEELAKQIEAAPAKSGEEGPVVERGQRATKQETWLGSRLGAAKVGDIVVAPNPEGQHCIVRLDRLDPGEPDFTSSYEKVLEEYRYHHDEEPFRKFCAELRTRFPVVIHQDVLDTVRVPG